MAKPKRRWLMPAAVGLTLLLSVMALGLGASGLTLTEMLTGLGDAGSKAGRILYHVRLPRVLATLLCGAALGVAGAILQSVLHNPLAGPNIIGVNAGAGLGATLCMALLPAATAMQVSLSAFAGAALAVTLVYLIARAAGASRLSLVLSGVALSSLMTAGIDAVTTFLPKVLSSVTQFKLGSAASVTLRTVTPLLWLVPIAILLCCLFGSELELLSLGDETASSLGMRPGRWRAVFLLLSCVLAGSAISVMGLVGFVGLLVPHMARLLSGGGRRALPLSALLGASLLTLCDLGARLLFAPYELPVGILLSVLGAPFFLFLLIRRK